MKMRLVLCSAVMLTGVMFAQQFLSTARVEIATVDSAAGSAQTSPSPSPPTAALATLTSIRPRRSARQNIPDASDLM